MRPGELDELLELVAREGGRDLRDYARPALARRLEERLAGRGDPAECMARLRGDRQALRRLGDELLVRATGWFRDPEVFGALGSAVAPALARALAPGLPLRAWSLGCATGEEPWSLAATLLRCLPPGRDFLLLASDVDPAAVRSAREACYDPGALESIPPALRGAFQRRGDGDLEPVPALRERVLFDTHDLVSPRLAPRQAIVAWFDLIACRNLLLYLDSRLRGQALGRLVAALRPGGALVLGRDEASVLTEELPRFEPFPGIDPGLRIYRRAG